jgi:copper chaperone CopZ
MEPESEMHARTVTVEIHGMTCDHCERRVSKALAAVPAVTKVLEVSRETGEARIVAAEAASLEAIEEAVRQAGYRARVRRDSRPSA